MNTTARIKYPSATAGLQTRTVLTHSEERRKVSRASPWKTCVKIKAAETHIFWLLVSYMSKAQKVPERCCKCNSAASFIRLRHDLRVWCMNMNDLCFSFLGCSRIWSFVFAQFVLLVIVLSFCTCEIKSWRWSLFLSVRAFSSLMFAVRHLVSVFRMCLFYSNTRAVTCVYVLGFTSRSSVFTCVDYFPFPVLSTLCPLVWFTHPSLCFAFFLSVLLQL